MQREALSDPSSRRSVRLRPESSSRLIDSVDRVAEYFTGKQVTSMGRRLGLLKRASATLRGLRPGASGSRLAVYINLSEEINTIGLELACGTGEEMRGRPV